MSAATVSPARRAAHAVVLRTIAEGAYADRAFHGEAEGLAPRDRQLAKRLAFGTVQRRGTLDWVAGRYTHGTLEPRVRAALQLGLYQLLFMDGVAPHAAVGEAVELAKPSRGHRVVNAVLRRVQREGVELPADDTPEGAAVRHAHPLWLVQMWWDWLGPGPTRALLRACNEPAELALRVNPLAPAAALDDIPGTREGDTIIVSGPFDAFSHPGYAAGAFTPQSRAAQRVGTFVDPQPGERVLDLCAAPGGKTTHLAALMGGAGEIVAVERHAGRAAALERTCARMHAGNVRVVRADALEFRDRAGFDRVLLDPPCSGLGTLQSHPDLRWRVTPADVAELAAQQRRLLAAARKSLRPGGRLVYAVCTLSPDEELLQGVERWRTLPSVDGTDGFYSAADVGG
ncbi:MAG TPA: transcription antitermination factor NusB [Solirubrobacteraceae bacterium]|nr:transcription antitermination factor NusB [Solirubrobacteraceae bacterium]